MPKDLYKEDAYVGAFNNERANTIGYTKDHTKKEGWMDMKYDLRKLLNAIEMKEVLDQLYEAFGLPSAIVDRQGEILTTSGWKTICHKYFWKSSQSEHVCRENDRHIYSEISDDKDQHIYKCPHGLIYCSVPIRIRGEHIGSFFIGHFLMDKPDESFIDYIVEQSDIDKKDFKETLEDIPVYTEEEMNRYLKFVRSLAKLIASQALKNIVLEENMEKLVATKELAVQANASKSIFLAKMSHEIRTPMNAILGLGNILGKTELSQKQHDYLRMMNQSATSLLGIINDILDFSKLEAGKVDIEEIRLNIIELLEQLIEMIAYRIEEKDVEVHIDISHAIPMYLIGDELRLRQILNNLMSNAVKFTDEGDVLLKVQMEDERNQQADENMCHVEFIVKDTGRGMNEDQIEKLSRPFEQGERFITRQYGGTGLGMAITYQLVERMGGKIEVESVPNIGTTFKVVLPFKLDEDTNTIHQAFIEHPLEQMRVLVVDDNPISCDVLEHQLLSIGILVTKTTDPYEALMLSNENNFDIIFIDWQMPGINGIELGREMKKKGELASHNILFSAYLNRKALEEAKEAGFQDVLSKPILPSMLYNSILKTMDIESEVKLKKDMIVEQRLDFLEAEVLVAEDNEINQLLDIEILSAMNIKVDIVTDGYEAINRYMEKDYDAVLMDIQMPAMDGYEATRRIRNIEKRTKKHIPIIAMTAHALAGDDQRSFVAGMDAHVTKPVNPVKLMDTLKEYLPYEVMEDTQITNRGYIFKWVDDLSDYDVDIHYEKGIERVNGNEAFYIELIKKYVTNNKDVLENQLMKALRSDNREQLLQDIHKLKGTAGNLELEYIHELASILNDELKEQESMDSERIKELIDVVVNSIHELERFLVDHQLMNQEEENETDTTHFNDEQEQQIYKEFIHSLESHHMNQIKRNWEKYKKTSHYNALEEKEKVKKAVESYRFDEALKWLEAYAHRR